MKVNNSKRSQSKVKKQLKTNVPNFCLKVKTKKFMSNFKEMTGAELEASRCKAYNYAL